MSKQNTGRQSGTVFEAGRHGGLLLLGHAIVQLFRFGEKFVGVRHATQAVALQRAPVATAQLGRVVVAVAHDDGRRRRRRRRRGRGRVDPYRGAASSKKSTNSSISRAATNWASGQGTCF